MFKEVGFIFNSRKKEKILTSVEIWIQMQSFGALNRYRHRQQHGVTPKQAQSSRTLNKTDFIFWNLVWGWGLGGESGCKQSRANTLPTWASLTELSHTVHTCQLQLDVSPPLRCTFSHTTLPSNRQCTSTIPGPHCKTQKCHKCTTKDASG